MSASANIPVIDISGDPTEVSKALVDAAEDHGFIYIKNIGRDISPEDIDGAFKTSEKIFGLPLEEKQKYAIGVDNRGWTGMHSEILDPDSQKVGDFKEAFNFGEFKDGKAQQPLPPAIAGDEEQIKKFTDSCHFLCKKILHLLGLGLGVDDFFSSAHERAKGTSGTTLRLLRYPPPETTNHTAGDMRAGAHSDYGSITLLFRLKGQAGLEILKKDNTWAPVPVCPPGTESDPSPPILINIADLLSYWTNGLFRSTVHRVVFNDDGKADIAGETSTGPRYSIAFFCHPVGKTPLEPVPSQRVKDFKPTDAAPNLNPYAERKMLTADEHLLMRLSATYVGVYEKNSTS
ncbi:hypothetical protein N3K66_006809 [Trichothecium roseum]|uniref:Uncharacterized protein n=1 Tax=Trichothecium roseum TaxID=47278 RepID=A0ACC0UWU0_9HYPO|nr:hypothetical protein N3K66_006809 [Trichothecium roseum]